MRLVYKKILATAALISATYATVTYADSFQGTASATIVDKITITQNKELSFGTFAVGQGGGKMQSDGTVTEGDIIPISGASNATFTVVGKPSASITVSGDATVTWQNAPSGFSATLEYPTNVALSMDGTKAINVAGLLIVPGSAPAGQYTGTYNLNVIY